MNKEILKSIILRASEKYKEYPSYITGGKPKYLRLSNGVKVYFVKVDSIDYHDSFVEFEIFQSKPWDISNLIHVKINLPYISILSVSELVYDDGNNCLPYSAWLINVSELTLPFLKSY